MIQDILQKVGLSSKEADIFLANMQLGTQPASIIARHVNSPRNTVRSILDQLNKKKLITKTTKGNTQLYTTIEPENIIKVLEMKKNHYINDINKKIDNIQSIIPELKTLAPQTISLPKIQFFEGKEGIFHTLEDTLNSSTEILTFSDVHGIINHIQDYNAQYSKERIERGIYERVIIPNTPEVIKFCEDYNKEATHMLFVPEKFFPFSLEVNIYDNKVSYVYFEEEKYKGIIIESPEIYATQKALFEMAWENAKTYKEVKFEQEKKAKKEKDKREKRFKKK